MTFVDGAYKVEYTHNPRIRAAIRYVYKRAAFLVPTSLVQRHNAVRSRAQLEQDARAIEREATQLRAWHLYRALQIQAALDREPIQVSSS
jgi:hypothetical protein